MPTCNDCKFWNRKGDPHIAYVEENDYAGVDMPQRKCLNIIHGNSYEGAKEMATAPAAVLDGSGYAASLWTLPTFGCNAFELSQSELCKETSE